MAHKKGVGSSSNGRESESKRLGVKIFGGQHCIAGNIIVIISFIPCNKNFCIVSFNGKKYIDHILTIFNNSNIAIFCLFLCSIITGALKLLNNVVINNFTVCHLFLFFQTEEIISDTLYQINSNIAGLNLGIIFVCNALEIILAFVFLEIIEIKYHNLSENTIKNIQKRAENETNLIINEYNENEEDNDSASDEEKKKNAE